MLEEAVFTCPWCWQSQTIVVDCSGGDAEYVEDCTVCCRPIAVRVSVAADGALEGVSVSREND